MAERKYGEAAPETEATIAGAAWYGEDLSGRSYSKTLFVDLDLTETTSDGVVFKDCTFRRARFNASHHRHGAFVNCTFTSCNFYATSFEGCKFMGSMFDGSRFEITNIEGGNWSFVGLPGADLRRAVFKDVLMREADLTGARCDGGTMTKIDFSGAWFHGASFSRCDLRGSDISSIEPGNVTLKGAIVTIEQTVMIAEALGLIVRAS